MNWKAPNVCEKLFNFFLPWWYNWRYTSRNLGIQRTCMLSMFALTAASSIATVLSVSDSCRNHDSIVDQHNHLSTGITTRSCIQNHIRVVWKTKWPGRPWQPSLKFVPGKMCWQLKVAGLILTILPTEYWLVYKMSITLGKQWVMWSTLCWAPSISLGVFPGTHFKMVRPRIPGQLYFFNAPYFCTVHINQSLHLPIDGCTSHFCYWDAHLYPATHNLVFGQNAPRNLARNFNTGKKSEKEDTFCNETSTFAINFWNKNLHNTKTEIHFVWFVNQWYIHTQLHQKGLKSSSKHTLGWSQHSKATW